MSGPEHKNRYRKHIPPVLILLIISLLIAVPVLADYLGPDRHTVTLVKVRDPDHDVWTLKKDNPPTGYLDTCIAVHTCDEHPSREWQEEWCGWVADRSGCEKAYKYEEQEVILPEATIGSNLANCSLTSGWCTSSPTLNLVGNEPLAGESILAVEGTYNGATFACGGSTCNVPMGEGGNAFTFWAISSYGDSKRMGNASAQVDTRPPTVSGNLSGAAGDNGWWVSEPTLTAAADDPMPGSGMVSFSYALDGGGWTSYSGPITIPEGGMRCN